MSFFGIDNDIENERRKYLEGKLDDGSDIPVYTWGTERYDGLADVLQEGDDDLNDETFGGTEPVGASPYALENPLLTLFFVGKDFDFSQAGQAGFFADDAPGIQSTASQPRQNTFDRNPLLESRSHLTS